MRILIHMGDPYTDNAPNSKRMMTFSDELIREGHTVTVLSPKCQKYSVDDGVKIICCPMINPRKKSGLKRMLSQLSYGITSLFLAVRAGKTDVVLTTSPPALISPAGWLIARLKRAALVYDVRDIWPDVALEMGSFKVGSIYEKGFRHVRNLMLKKADLVTAVSPGKVAKLKGYSKKTDVVLISNGFDTRFLNNAEKSEIIDEYDLRSGFTCVYVGKLGLAQGLSRLLDLAERAQKEGLPIRFLLFGSGVEELFLKEQARDRGLNNVKFCGTVSNDRIYTVLKNAGVCFVPLVNEKLTDSIPTKLYEALGVGCPVLLSACGDSADVLEETGLGISAAPGDDVALWNGLMTIYEKTDWSAEKEKAYELMTSKYSRQTSAEQLVQELTKRFDGKHRR